MSEAINIDGITPDMILSVYSGRRGCACGCRGKHYVNSKHAAAVAAEWGYPVDSADVSDVMVRRVLKKLQANQTTEVQDERIVHAEIGERLYLAYLRPRDAA